MFDTISITDLQKSPKQALQATRGLRYILASNKKRGALIDEGFLGFLESGDFLTLYEDWSLARDKELLKRSDEVLLLNESGKIREKTLSLEQL